MNKKIFTALVAIACTLVLATGCSVTPHEDVMKSDPAVEQTETTANDNDSKTVAEDADKSDAQSDTDKKSDETVDAETDKQSDSKSDSGSSNQNHNSGSANSSASKPSTGNSGSSTNGGNSSSNNSSASKPSTGNSGSSNASKPSQPAQDSKPSEPAKPAKPAHTHTWVWATHTETTPEQSHIVETKKYVCNNCGQQFDNVDDAGRHCVADFWDNCENYTYKVVDSHKVVDVPAKTITVNDYQYCSSCKERK